MVKSDMQIPDSILNTHIAKAILSSNLVLWVERAFLLQEAHRYISEVEAGVTALEIGRRKAALKASMIVFANSTYTVINNPFMLSQPSITPNGSFALVRLQGFLAVGDMACMPSMREVSDVLRTAYANPGIDAIILEINSGGGEAAAMDLLVSVLSERNKPVISFAHFAASAAYGIASVTDEIISLESARLGSIGAMLQLSKAEQASLAADTVMLVGSDSPNKNKEYIQALGGDYTGLQSLVDAETARFHAIVRKNRQLRGDENRISNTLSGDMFYAQDAKRRGLIDGIGNFNYVLERTQAWARKYKRERSEASPVVRLIN